MDIRVRLTLNVPSTVVVETLMSQENYDNLVAALDAGKEPDFFDLALDHADLMNALEDVTVEDAAIVKPH